MYLLHHASNIRSQASARGKKKKTDSRKGAKNRKHFNLKNNQLSKLYSSLDDTAEHHKTTGMGHNVLFKNHPRWDRRERESGKKKQKQKKDNDADRPSV